MSNFSQLESPLSRDEIERLLPHRPPFLLVDSILEWEPRQRCVGIKTFQPDDPFFQGHFPGCPIMPGVVVVEAMAQVAGLLAMESFSSPTSFFFLAQIEKARFHRVVKPGDQLTSEATLRSLRPALFKTCVVGHVDGHLVAQCEFTFVISKTESPDILRDTIHAEALLS